MIFIIVGGAIICICLGLAALVLFISPCASIFIAIMGFGAGLLFIGIGLIRDLVHGLNS